MPTPIAARHEAGALYLIDSSIYVFRAWHSLPGSITDKHGKPANAVFGFIEFLHQLISKRKPALLVCAFDQSLSSSIRNTIYPQYKANRSPAPQDLKDQFAHCRAFAQAVGISTYSSPSVEADDIIGTLAQTAARQNLNTVIVSADKDLCQFVGEGDAVWDYAKDTWLDARLIEKRFGVRPQQIADLLALSGDKVDNIPGVPGVGIATAARLLVKWGNLDVLLNNTSGVAKMKFRGAKRVSELLYEHADTIRLARQLTGLWVDETLPDNCEGFTITPDIAALQRIFDELNMGNSRRNQWLALLNL